MSKVYVADHGVIYCRVYVILGNCSNELIYVFTNYVLIYSRICLDLLILCDYIYSNYLIFSRFYDNIVLVIDMDL